MSIRARLLLLTLLLTALPALWQVVRFVQERDEAVEADTGRLVQLAQRRAELIDDRLLGTTQLLYGLARARDLESNERDACSAFLVKVLAAHPQYTGLLTIKPDGSLFCDSLRSGRQLDLRDRGYFKAAQALAEGVATEPVFGRLTGLPVLQVAHPVRADAGELQFVLLGSLSLKPLAELASPPVPGAWLVLLDAKGGVLASSRSGPGAEQPGTAAMAALVAFANQPGGAHAQLPDAAGAPIVWARADSPRLHAAGLRVLAAAPRGQLVAMANRRLVQDLTALLLVAAAVFAGVWLLVERAIRKPVARISNMAAQLAGGDLAARIEPPLPRGELGTLMQELNDTARSLQQQQQDIAELGERLRQSQRLEAVGQLTGGVAHDFNNLLTVVMGNAELLTELNRDDARQRVLAEMIATAAQRGADLTQRLLAFARKQALAPKVVDLNTLLAGLDPMLRRTLGEHIEIEMIRAAGLWPAQVDPGQLENALLNLCLNARDAMPRGGRLTLETANARLDADYAARHAEVVPGQYVMVAVTDTGAGIAPEHLKRVFEPFFTTKEPGKGTGLGLAMVYGFIKQSAGHVSVYSEPGQGTSVKLYLPRATSAAVPGAEGAGEAAPQGGRGCILLVEDDEQVREYAAAQLRSFGYTVLEAADGPAALTLLQQRGPIDLLFTDVVMPGGMNGRVLADTARGLQPGLRVLYTSGYTENAIVHHGRLDEGARLLSKPYRRSELDRAVREALEAPAGGA
jgi:signal transduction histidine kinase/CheY-like chemotaxis protein